MNRTGKYNVWRGAFKRTLLSGMCGTVLLWCAPPPAHAYEGRLSLDGRLGYGAVLAASGHEPCCGVGAGLSLSYGFSDTWTGRVGVDGAAHLGSDDFVRLGALAEALYLVDIVELVPFAGAGTGLFVTEQEGDVRVHPAVHGVAGVDYLLGPTVAVGADFRLFYFPLPRDRGERLEPMLFTLEARVSLLWDVQ